MRSTLLHFPFILLTVLSSLQSCNKQKNNVASINNSESKKSKEQRILDAMEYRFGMMVNPDKGYFDMNDYFMALNKTKDLASSKSDKQFELEWQIAGPDNVGGRTRALIIDKDDPNLLFSGSVSGGLYKSVNKGMDWKFVDEFEGFSAIASMAQSSEGTIFVGTGEGYATFPGNLLNFTGNSNHGNSTPAHPGNGLYLSMDKGESWEQVASTNIYTGSQTSPINGIDAWSQVNYIETHPTNPDIMLVSNRRGIWYSTNATADADFIEFNQPNGINTLDQGQDIAFNSSGTIVLASVRGRVYRSINNGLSWTITTLPINNGRTEVEFAPSNDNVAYAFNAANNQCLGGLWRTKDAGLSWTRLLQNSGLESFDPFEQPFAVPGTNSCQGLYDMAIGVNPMDEDMVYLGGITLWTYSVNTGGLKRADQISFEGAGYPDPEYIHADKHAILFDPSDPTGETMFVLTDGGVTICENALSGFPDNFVFKERNKNYTTLSCWNVSAGLYGEVMAGSQDNGSQYIDTRGNSIKAAKEVLGGDGGYSEISKLDENVLFFESQNGNLERSTDRGGKGSLFNFNTQNITGVPAVCTFSFANPLALFETDEWPLASNTAFSIVRDVFVNSQGATIPGDTVLAGDVIELTSGNTGITWNATVIAVDLPSICTLPDGSQVACGAPGDTLRFTDNFMARFFLSTSCGVWMCTNPLDGVLDPIWVRISTDANAKGYTMSPDMDVVYYTRSNQVVRISGLNSQNFGTSSSANPSAFSNLSRTFETVGGNVTGIDINPDDPNHVVVTRTGFGSFPHVYEIRNFDGLGGQTLTSLQPNDNELPYMPVYDVVVDADNTNRYFIGTELGVWSYDVTLQSWAQESDPIGNVPVYGLRQEPLYEKGCNVLYAGVHGKGIWYSTTLTEAGCDLIRGKLPTSIATVNQDIAILKAYPNPVQSKLNVEFELTNAADVQLLVVDMLGRVVEELNYADLKTGNVKLEINASNYNTGSYLAVISTDKGKTHQSAIFIKR